MGFELENLLKQKFNEHNDCRLLVKSARLKILFNRLRQFYSKATYNKTLQVTLKDYTLYIRASDSLHLLDKIEIEEHVSGVTEMKANYVFSDLEKMIAGNGDATVILAQSMFRIECSGAKLTLQASMTEVPNINFDLSYTQCNTNRTSATFAAFKTLTPLTKCYKKYPPIAIGDKLMQMKFPGVYIQGPASGPSMTLDYSSAYLIDNLMLAPARQSVTLNEDIEESEDDEEYDEETEVYSPVGVAQIKSSVFLKSDNLYMSFIKSQSDEIRDMNEIVKDYTYLGHFTFRFLYTKLKQLQQSVGEGDVLVAIHEKYIQVTCTRNGNAFNIEVGEPCDSPKILEFRYRLEMLTPIAGYIGDEFELYMNGGMLCLKYSDYLILMSVLS